MLCCLRKTKPGLSGDSSPWEGCHRPPRSSPVPTAAVTQLAARQLLPPRSGTHFWHFMYQVVILNGQRDEQLGTQIVTALWS